MHYYHDENSSVFASYTIRTRNNELFKILYKLLMSEYARMCVRVFLCSNRIQSYHLLPILIKKCALL